MKLITDNYEQFKEGFEPYVMKTNLLSDPYKVFDRAASAAGWMDTLGAGFYSSLSSELEEISTRTGG